MKLFFIIFCLIFKFLFYQFSIPYWIVFPAGALGYIACNFPVEVAVWLIIIIIIIIITTIVREYTLAHFCLSYFAFGCRILWKFDTKSVALLPVPCECAIVTC